MSSTSSSLKKSPTYLSEVAEERVRIARELHDGIAQNLAAVGYALDAEIGRSDTTQESRAALRGIRNQVTQLNQKVRDEIFLLRNFSEDDSKHWLESAAAELGITLEISGVPIRDAELEKVLRELLRNAASHSNSSSGKVSFKADAVLLQFDIPAKMNEIGAGKVGESYGLIGVQERLRDIDWTASFSEDFATISLRKN